MSTKKKAFNIFSLVWVSGKHQMAFLGHNLWKCRKPWSDCKQTS